MQPKYKNTKILKHTTKIKKYNKNTRIIYEKYNKNIYQNTTENTTYIQDIYHR